MTRLTLAGFAYDPFPDHQDVKTVSSCGLTAVCYEPDNDNKTTHPALLHNQLVNNLSQYSAFLPVRFGWSVGSLAELATLLNQHTDTIFERIAKIGHCAEVSVFVRLPQIPEPRDGKTYLATQVNWIKAARALKERLAHLVDELSNAQCGIVDVRFDAVNLAHTSLRIDLAIAKTNYENAIVETRKSFKNYAIIERITGPFAPYGFSDIALKTEAAA
jgi:hypothetical protein